MGNLAGGWHTPGVQVPGVHAEVLHRKVKDMSKTATYMKTLTGFKGEARLYKTSDQGNVVVSAIAAAFDTIAPMHNVFTIVFTSRML